MTFGRAGILPEGALRAKLQPLSRFARSWGVLEATCAEIVAPNLQNFAQQGNPDSHSGPSFIDLPFPSHLNSFHTTYAPIQPPCCSSSVQSPLTWRSTPTADHPSQRSFEIERIVSRPRFRLELTQRCIHNSFDNPLGRQHVQRHPNLAGARTPVPDGRESTPFR